MVDEQIRKSTLELLQSMARNQYEDVATVQATGNTEKLARAHSALTTAYAALANLKGLRK